VDKKRKSHIFLVREWGRDLGFNLEIGKCLEEYYGNENVEMIVIPNNVNIVNFFIQLISEKRPLRIYMDTRIFIVDASLNSLTGHLIDVSIVNRILNSAGIIPVCICTDPLQPGFILVAELLTRNTGILITMGADSTLHKFSDEIGVGATFNPISYSTGLLLKESTTKKSKNVYLGGNMYEPRVSYFNKVVLELKMSDVSVDILPKKANRYIDYLTEMSKFKIILNTNFISSLEKKHMVGRNVESFHVGSLLLTQNTPLLQRYFTEGVHYIDVGLPSDAAEKIIYYLMNPAEASRIALAGQEKALQYSRDQIFLNLVNLKISQSLLLGIK